MMTPATVAETGRKVVSSVEKVIIGKHQVIELVLCALFSEGHLLIEDVPGVGKTMLAKAVARSLGCSYARIQCTPDLLPSDILGVNVFNQKTGDFLFRSGPIHHHIVLVDEINRATPKTQSALLECMEERQVSIDTVTMALPRPFMVIATQNPIETDGTFPLPEAQLDRFFMRLSLGYPSFDAENEMLVGQQLVHPIEGIKAVVTLEELMAMQQIVKAVHVEATLREYIVKIVQKTRDSSTLSLGASPRGSLSLFRASQAHGALKGRDYVIPDDVKAMASVTLSHRIKGRYDFSRNGEGQRVIQEVLGEVTVPV
ncbi:MAG: MoxR family ATPase [Candidatus Eremiobacteraeota bacterium]|nr:MoxR family ATPase [Candidatus Eremiobacteraeota bacterium]